MTYTNKYMCVYILPMIHVYTSRLWEDVHIISCTKEGKRYVSTCTTKIEFLLCLAHCGCAITLIYTQCTYINSTSAKETVRVHLHVYLNVHHVHYVHVTDFFIWTKRKVCLCVKFINLHWLHKQPRHSVFKYIKSLYSIESLYSGHPEMRTPL